MTLFACGIAIIVLAFVAAHFWTDARIAYRWIEMLECRGRYQSEEIQHQQETIRQLRKELHGETKPAQVVQ